MNRNLQSIYRRWRIRRLPLATLIILALNIIGFIFELVKGENYMLTRYAMYQGAIQDGEWLRVPLHAFLHIGFPHILCNMFCLVTYGLTLEQRIGSVRFALIYVAGIIGSAVLINITGGFVSTGYFYMPNIHAGASGALWGLMAAMLVYCLRNHLNPTYALRGIVLNLIYSFSFNVSWQGHIGGGIAGALAALMLLRDQ